MSSYGPHSFWRLSWPRLLPDHLLCCLWILGRQGKQQSENEVTGGRQLTDNPKDVARMLKKDGKDSDIRIGDLPIIRDSEIQNFCLHGTVGAGKSEVIRRLANYARQRGDMVVIYDRSGNLLKVTMIPPSIKS